MRCMIWTLVALAGWSASVSGDERSQRRGQVLPEEPLEVRTYPVADLVVPLPGAKEKDPNFTDLERYLRDCTGEAVWKDGGSIKPYAATLSLVIRQKASVHNKIADAMSALRRELDVQVVLEFSVVDGPRREIAALADAFPGEFGKFETEQLLQRVEESETLKLVMAPKVTAFSRQTVQLKFDDQAISANSTVAADRRSVTVKVAAVAEKEQDLLAAVQTVQLHSGRSAALRFEAPQTSIVPPSANAPERLIVVTARVIVVVEKEEEAAPSTVLIVTPRGHIDEVEEGLLPPKE